jgi:hypothetical protein
MLQWNARLFAVLTLVVMVAAMVGEFGEAGGFNFGW